MATSPCETAGRGNDPYRPCPVPPEVLRGMPTPCLPMFKQLTRPMVLVMTLTQIFVVLIAYRYWMMGANTNLRTLVSPFWESLGTGASFAGLFVFLNYTIVSLVYQQKLFAAENGEPNLLRQWISEPESRGEWTMPLILALSAVFAVIGIVMSAIHWRIHPVSMFLFTVCLLVLLSCSLQQILSPKPMTKSNG